MSRPVVEKLPVDFNLDSLPSLPQDDGLLVWVLKTKHAKKKSQPISDGSWRLYVISVGHTGSDEDKTTQQEHQK